MAALQVGKMLGSGAIGAVYEGRLGRRAVIVKVSHVGPKQDINAIMAETLAFCAAAKESPFFLELLQITAMPGHEFKHPVPKFVRDAPKQNKWYFDFHNKSRMCIQEIYTPPCKETAAQWFERDFDRLGPSVRRRLLGYLAHHCASLLVQEQIGWFHCDAHAGNIMSRPAKSTRVKIGRQEYDIPGRQWIWIDYGLMWQVGTPADNPDKKRTKANPHLWLAMAMYCLLFQPWWHQAEKDGRAAKFPPPLKLATNLVRRAPHLDIKCPEPETRAALIAARAIRLDPDVYFEVLGLRDDPYDAMLEATKTRQNISIDEFERMCSDVMKPRRMLEWLIQEIA
jgi:hypothetical protein